MNTEGSWSRIDALEALMGEAQHASVIERNFYAKYPFALDVLFSLWRATGGKAFEDPVSAFHRQHEFEETDVGDGEKILTVVFHLASAECVWSWIPDIKAWLNEDGDKMCALNDDDAPR